MSSIYNFVSDINDNFVIVRIFIFEIDDDITIRMVEVLKIEIIKN